MLEIQDLTVDYGNGPVLDALDLQAASGLVHGLVGRNGEGKTTLLNAIYGTVRASAGLIRWNARPIKHEEIAYLHTELYFYPLITGREYLEVFHSQHPSFDIEGWNSIFELPLSEYISAYSTGMKKKLALMAVLSMERPLVILDEPFNGLDLESNLLLGRIIRTVSEKGKTVIVTSHIIESLTGVCDLVHLLQSGRIARTYNSEELDELKSDLIAHLEVEKMPAIARLIG